MCQPNRQPFTTAPRPLADAPDVTNERVAPGIVGRIRAGLDRYPDQEFRLLTADEVQRGMFPGGTESAAADATCILTGADGENPDDCTTHDHETADLDGPRTPENVTESALDAFWTVVADRYPEAVAGDLDPVSIANLRHYAQRAVTAWVALNTPTADELEAARRGPGPPLVSPHQRTARPCTRTPNP